MVKKIVGFTFLQLVWITWSFAQTPLSALSLDTLTGTETGQVRVFTESSLYGYIDGGAELYLEYGFDTLVVTDLVAGGNDIRVEVYRMEDADAAFGIFSVSRFRCNGGPVLTEHMCRSAYQLQFCRGPFYVSIVNDTGGSTDQATADRISKFLLENISDPPFAVSDFFTDVPDAETMKSAVLVRGPLGIYNGIPYISDKMESAKDYTALIIRKGEKVTASVIFNTPGSLDEFLRANEITAPADSTLTCKDSVISEADPKHIIVTF